MSSKLRFLDPIVVIGVVISIALAIILVLMGQDQAISLLVGLSITTITLLIDNISRLKESEAAIIQISEHKIGHLASVVLSANQDAFYAVDKTSLYSTMLSFTKSARIRLDMMYLNDVPPAQLDPCLERDQFYSGFDEIISDGTVPVKRIVLLTDNNKTWIKKYIRRHKGRKNFSLYVIKDKPVPPVSIQIIDNRFVILISVFRHALSGTKKHLIFEAPNLALVFQSHYNAVLDKSTAIIENGHLIESNFQQYLG